MEITNHMTRVQHSRGFTLMEILISVGILATVGVLIVQVVFTTTNVNTKAALLADIKQNGEFAMDVMSRHIRGAASVETNCGIQEATTPSAAIRTLEHATTTLLCHSDGVAARIASMDAQANISYITGNTVTLSASGLTSCDDSTLSFSCLSGTGVAEPVTIQFTLRQTGTGTSIYDVSERSFVNTVNVRN